MATDDFNRADQTGLGTSSEAWSWSNPDAGAGMDIVSNAAAADLAGGRDLWRADQDVGSDDMFSEVTVTGLQAAEVNFHLCARFDPAAVTAYQFLFKNSTTNTWILNKIVGGSGSTLEAANDTVPTPPFRLRIETVADGANAALRCLVDGVVVITHTDSSSPITGNERGGMGVSGDHSTTGITVDDFGVGQFILADAGSYSVTGVNAGLLVGHRLVADVGSYSIVGADAGLTAATAPVLPVVSTETLRKPVDFAMAGDQAVRPGRVSRALLARVFNERS